MDTKTALDVLMKRLGNRKETSLRASCLQEMNLVIQALESGPFLPWFLEAEADVTLAQGASSADLPADFLQEYDGGLPYIVGSDEDTTIEKGLYEDLMEEYRNSSDTGEPRHYAIYGSKIYFGPTADQEYTLKLPYLKKTSELADDTAAQTTWLDRAAGFIIAETGSVVADFYLQNANLAQRLKNTALEIKRELFKAHEMRKHTNNDYTLSRVN